MAGKEVRLIDANDVHRLIDKNLDINKGKGCSLSETLVREIVDSTPTIDPESLRPQWISVKDRLPEKEGWYHVAILDIKNGKYAVEQDLYAIELAKRNSHKPGFCKARRWEEREKLTHWMPLPEPPKEA